MIRHCTSMKKMALNHCIEMRLKNGNFLDCHQNMKCPHDSITTTLNGNPFNQRSIAQ